MKLFEQFRWAIEYFFSEMDGLWLKQLYPIFQNEIRLKILKNYLQVQFLIVSEIKTTTKILDIQLYNLQLVCIGILVVFLIYQST